MKAREVILWLGVDGLGGEGGVVSGGKWWETWGLGIDGIVRGWCSVCCLLICASATVRISSIKLKICVSKYQRIAFEAS